MSELLSPTSDMRNALMTARHQKFGQSPPPRHVVRGNRRQFVVILMPVEQQDRDAQTFATARQVIGQAHRCGDDCVHLIIQQFVYYRLRRIMIV